ncbi:MAG: tRNA (adenine(22)-N(1))-methyltransferase TrmK [Bacilli bacterium]
MTAALSKRLNSIYSMLDEKCYVADIGADHGQLVIKLAKTYINNKFFAVENKNGPFNTLKQAIDLHKCKNIEISLSSGISNIPNYVNTLVICGMGGDNIYSIILDNLEKLFFIETIVFSAHSKSNIVITLLNKLGFSLTTYKKVDENGKIYDLYRFDLNGKNEIFLGKYYINLLFWQNHNPYDIHYSNIVLKNYLLYKNSIRNHGFLVFKDEYIKERMEIEEINKYEHKIIA